MVLLTLTAIAAGAAGAGVTWSRCLTEMSCKSFLSRALGSPCLEEAMDLFLKP